MSHDALSDPDLERTETLDPSDWEVMRDLGHRMLDDSLDQVAAIRKRPVWQPLPDWVRESFTGPLPRDGGSLEAAYAQFQRTVAAYPLGNLHPRFWGWVIGGGTPGGMLAEMLAAGLNSNVFGATQAPQLLELQVIRWLAELIGLPSDASGILVSGGSMANLVALTVGRKARAPFDVADGLAGRPQLVLYASRETHNSVARAAEMLGLGRRGYRQVAVDADYRLDLGALAAAIAEDRAAGRVPVAVVGNLGTVATGASDDLDALAELCAREGLWLHVDAAFGAALALLPERDPRLAGLERADSVAFDLHKWFHVPYEAGCVLVRERSAHLRAFAGGSCAGPGVSSEPDAPPKPSYLGRTARGVGAEGDWMTDFGPQLSRGFRALKVWFAFRELGAARLGRMVAKNLAQARYLARRVAADPRFELMAPAPMNIVCLRHRGNGLTGPALDCFNEELLARLHESGVAVPTHTRLAGAFAIRVSLCNHRTTRSDLDLLLATLADLAAGLLAEPPATVSAAG
jgi:glutamate/tyrosine decarboxylase-like PLP-dependent enzyme